MYFNAFHPLTLDNYCLCVCCVRERQPNFQRERRTEFNYAKEKKNKIRRYLCPVWLFGHGIRMARHPLLPHTHTVYLVPAILLLLCHTVDCCSVTMGPSSPIVSATLLVRYRIVTNNTPSAQRTRMAELRIYVLSIFFLVSFSIFVVDL